MYFIIIIIIFFFCNMDFVGGRESEIRGKWEKSKIKRADLRKHQQQVLRKI